PPLVPRRVSGPLPAGRPPLHRRRDVLVDGRRAGGAVVEGGVTKKAAPASDGGPGTPWRGRSSGPAAPRSVNRLVTIAKQLLGNLDEPRRRHPTPDLIELLRSQFPRRLAGRRVEHAMNGVGAEHVPGPGRRVDDDGQVNRPGFAGGSNL